VRPSSISCSDRKPCTACRRLIDARRATGLPQVDISFPEIEKFDKLPEPRAEGPTAFVSIIEGCNKYCSFCVVPYTRGEEISRPFDDVMTGSGATGRTGRARSESAGPERQRLPRPDA
jgi:tRNA A37 methylthiotransferase MiaB